MSRKIIAIVDDLFFAAKIRGTAEQTGVSLSIPRGLDAAVEAATSQAPALFICDLNSLKIDPFALGRRLKADPTTASIPLLGFFSHVQTDLQRQAVEAGFDRVIPRSAFARSLVQILSGTE